MTLNSFLYVSSDGALIKWTPGGETVLRQNGSTQRVSCDYGGTIWVISSEDNETTGGCNMEYSSDGGSTWQKPGGKSIGAIRIAGCYKNNCFFITPANAVHRIDNTGYDVTIFGDKTAIEIGFGAIGTTKVPNNSNHVWVLSPEVYISPDNDWKKTGNMLKWFMDTNGTQLQSLSNSETYVASRITGWQNNSCLGVNPEGKLCVFSSTGVTQLPMTGIAGVVTLDSGPATYPALIIDDEPYYVMDNSNKEYTGGNTVHYYNGSQWTAPSPNTTRGAIDVSNYYSP